MISRDQLIELFNITMRDYPLPCKREYNFGPYPECETCSIERQRMCPHSLFVKGDE